MFMAAFIAAFMASIRVVGGGEKAIRTGRCERGARWRAASSPQDGCLSGKTNAQGKDRGRAGGTARRTEGAGTRRRARERSTGGTGGTGGTVVTAGAMGPRGVIGAS
ncbi:hypothetical protein GCM10023085_03270 [Actinomadura viridis]